MSFLPSNSTIFRAPKEAYSLSLEALNAGYELKDESASGGYKFTLVAKEALSSIKTPPRASRARLDFSPLEGGSPMPDLISLKTLLRKATSSKAILESDSSLIKTIKCAANSIFAPTDPLSELIQDRDFQLFSKTLGGAESLYTRLGRALKKASILNKGATYPDEGTILLKPHYWQEVLLEKHPYGADLQDYLDSWKRSKSSTCSFETWLAIKPSSAQPTSSIKYLTEEERALYQVSFVNGALFTSRNEILHTSKHYPLSEKKDKLAIYVISADQQMYVGSYNLGTFHHSSFCAGQPVLAAGSIQTNKHGIIEIMSNESGHYKPTAMQVHNALDFFRHHGVNLNKITLQENREDAIIHHESVADFIRKSPRPSPSPKTPSSGTRSSNTLPAPSPVDFTGSPVLGACPVATRIGMTAFSFLPL